MARLELSTLTRTITADALAHPTDLGPMLAKRHSLSRGTMTKHLKRLVESGWLERNGVRRPHFKPGVQREIAQRLPGLFHDQSPVRALEDALFGAAGMPRPA